MTANSPSPQAVSDAEIEALHEALGGDGWAYSNYGSNELKYCRDELIAGVLAVRRASPADGVVVPRGEVTDEWADRFCEAVNWSPDGQECKVVEGEMRCVTFRQIAKGHILAAIATGPDAASPALAATSVGGEAWNGPGTEPHTYSPDAMMMGDCRVCGHTREAHEPAPAGGGEARLVAVNPTEWTPCSPAWLEAHPRDCGTAPRVAAETWDGHSHYHPANWPSADAEKLLIAREALEKADAAARSGAAMSAAGYSVSAERLGEEIYKTTTPALARLSTTEAG